MDKNTVTGLLLMGMVLIGYTFFMAPGKEEIAAQKQTQDSLILVQKQRSADSVEAFKTNNTIASQATDIAAVLQNDSAKNVAMASTYGAFVNAAPAAEKLVYIENEKVKITLSSVGGKVKQVQLKNLKTFDGAPLQFYDDDSVGMGLSFFSENKSINTQQLHFEPQGTSFAVNGKNKKELIMRCDAGSGRHLDYIYTLEGNSYNLKFDIQLQGLNNVIAANSSYLELDWHASILKQERTVNGERQYSSVYYSFADNEVNNLSETSDEKESLNEKVKWVGFKQHFFSSVLIADKMFDPAVIEARTDLGSDTIVRYMSANLRIPYDHKADEKFGMSFYFGPNHFQTLKSYNLGMEKLIPLGWGILGWINRFIVIPVFNWLKNFGISFGLVILILTIIIKLILLPLNYRAYLSSAKMRVLQPEVTELQTKFKEEPLKMQQEMMGLYRKAGVSPFGGCWPMLMQMPILFAMLRFFPNSIELRQESFLWAKDLSTYDSILNIGFHIPGYGDHVSLWTILMTISTLLFTYFNSQQLNTAANPAMKWMMYLMPVLFLGFLNDFPAGLNYYYFLGNIISIGTQLLFKSFVDQDKIHLQIQENKKKPDTKKKSSFQERLEKMAKERGYQPPKK